MLVAKATDNAERIIEQICIEKLLSAVGPELCAWLKEKKPETAEELAKIANEHIQARKGPMIDGKYASLEKNRPKRTNEQLRNNGNRNQTEQQYNRNQTVQQSSSPAVQQSRVLAREEKETTPNSRISQYHDKESLILVPDNQVNNVNIAKVSVELLVIWKFAVSHNHRERTQLEAVDVDVVVEGVEEEDTEATPEDVELFAAFKKMNTRNLRHRQMKTTQPLRRIPFSRRRKVVEKLEQLEKLDVIEKVDGPTSWVNPLVVVEKSDGDVRICLDMRQANRAIVREKHPVPTVEETLQEVSGAKVFSKLDLNMAFHQIELHPDSRDITTFAGPNGLYRYKRLLFGVNNYEKLKNSSK
ncbi:hypothetical protein QZH41_008148 [Actinostola sp. cb2023]|nr:hypothetical protein QZH41_008148 [Actinostola sp. cb2023]